MLSPFSALALQLTTNLATNLQHLHPSPSRRAVD
jgi:hypothetical protein